MRLNKIMKSKIINKVKTKVQKVLKQKGRRDKCEMTDM